MIAAPSSTVSDALRTLESQLRALERPGEIGRKVSLSLLAGGKRLRPALLLAFAEFFGVPLADALPYAQAAEQVHAASLSHDDVIDDAELRRDRPTLNALVSNRRAILAGDWLLARTVGEVAALGRLDIARDLARALEELVDGEWRQHGARGRIDLSPEELETTAELKTASLLRWCCATPALLAGAPPEAVAGVRRLATDLGVAFQMVDDCLDYSPTSGKEPGKDFREGLINLVSAQVLAIRPELGPQIPQVWDEGAAPPWSESDLRMALTSVRARAALRVERALGELERLEWPGSEPGKAHLRDWLVGIGERNA